jgi:hypothetical protein
VRALEFTKCIIIQFYFIFTMRALNVNHKLPRDLELIRFEPVLAQQEVHANTRTTEASECTRGLNTDCTLP